MFYDVIRRADDDVLFDSDMLCFTFVAVILECLCCCIDLLPNLLTPEGVLRPE